LISSVDSMACASTKSRQGWNSPLRQLGKPRYHRRGQRSIDPGAQSLAWLHAAYRSSSTGRFEIA
jgi:hypothetical protein